jgi:RimJ/RimL family protein N-acetyltransferase
VELALYSDADAWLTVAIECDPRMMSELGGPITPEEAAEAHRRRVATVASDPWWFTIVLEPGERPVGMLGVWRSEDEGKPVDEIGWMVLPAYQGRGIATAALRMLLDRARDDPRFERVHAFPAVSNAPSNALCRKFGFSLAGERDVEFRGRRLRCNHWELGVGESAAKPGE